MIGHKSVYFTTQFSCEKLFNRSFDMSSECAEFLFKYFAQS